MLDSSDDHFSFHEKDDVIDNMNFKTQVNFRGKKE
jgi:hypothetical protein